MPERQEQEAAFAAALLVLLSNAYESNEPTSEAELTILPAVLAGQMVALAPTLRANLAEAARTGIRQSLSEHGIDGVLDIEDEAQRVANERMQTLLPQLQQSTMQQARTKIAAGLAAGLPLASIYASLRTLFSLQRSNLIATTEITYGINMGIASTLRLLGVVNAQQWVAILDDYTCPICSALAGSIWIDGKPAKAEGETVGPPVSINTPFVHPGGTGQQARYKGETFKHPPAHPKCRCYMKYVKIPL